MLTVLALIAVAVLGGVIGWGLERQRQQRQQFLEDFAHARAMVEGDVGYNPGYLVFPAVCSICSDRWVVTVGADWNPLTRLECKRCGTLTGDPDERWNPPV